MLANVSLAFTVNVSKEAINVPIKSSRTIDVSVYSPVSEKITFSIIGAESWMLLAESQLAINAGETKKTTLYLEPKETIVMNKQITLSAKSNTGEKVEKTIYISVVKSEGIDFDKLVVTGNLEPNGDITIQADVKNYGDVTKQNIIVDITVFTKTDAVYEEKDVIGKLDPGRDETVEKSFTLKKYAGAGEYTVSASVDGKTMQQKFVVPSIAVWDQDVKVVQSLLGYEKTIKIFNYGNKEDKLLISEDISGLESLFYYGTKPDHTEDVFGWDVRLNPGDTAVISYKIDYSLMISFLIVMLLASWIAFYRVNTVRMKKYIMQKKTIEKDEEYTVGINLNNGTGSKAEHVVVKDFVPSVFEVRTDTAGPKPEKKKSEHGTELTWKLNDLVNKEERIFTYKIVPIFGVSGHIFLPTASVKFVSNGKELENKSAVTKVGIKRIKETTLEDIFGKKK
ncbi:MAG: hypothetical protein V1900_04725 [Candidatus Aenigmatarchaeota archaeon]